MSHSAELTSISNTGSVSNLVLKAFMCILIAVIAARPSTIPYLSALLPSELELQSLEETDSSEQDDQTDGENTAGHMINVGLIAGG